MGDRKASYWQALNAFRKDTWEEKIRYVISNESECHEEAKARNYYALGDSVLGSFTYNWKKGFLLAYGRKGFKTKGVPRFFDPAMYTAIRLAVGRAPEQLTSNPGFVDYPNLLTMLALAVNALGGAMKRGAINKDDKLHSAVSKFLSVFRWIYGAIVQAPITIVAYIVQAAYLLVKAFVGVLFATVYAIGKCKKAGSSLEEHLLQEHHEGDIQDSDDMETIKTEISTNES